MGGRGSASGLAGGGYSGYSLSDVKSYIGQGQSFASQYRNEQELVYGEDISMWAMPLVMLGFNNPDYTPTEKTYYRIGEPKLGADGKYKNSWNSMDDRYESGVSVATSDWLNTLSSQFMATDDNISSRGVYKIKGVAIPKSGGDDEPLIIPTGAATKTSIKTRSGLTKAVKKK